MAHRDEGSQGNHERHNNALKLTKRELNLEEVPRMAPLTESRFAAYLGVRRTVLGFR